MRRNIILLSFLASLFIGCTDELTIGRTENVTLVMNANAT